MLVTKGVPEMINIDLVLCCRMPQFCSVIDCFAFPCCPLRNSCASSARTVDHLTFVTQASRVCSICAVIRTTSYPSTIPLSLNVGRPRDVQSHTRNPLPSCQHKSDWSSDSGISMSSPRSSAHPLSTVPERADLASSVSISRCSARCACSSASLFKVPLHAVTSGAFATTRRQRFRDDSAAGAFFGVCCEGEVERPGC